MRELSVQSASDNLTTKEQGYLDTEYQALLKEVDRLADSTKYNGQILLDGTFSGKSIQVGADAGAAFTISITIGATGASGLSINSSNIKSTPASSTAITQLDTAINRINTQRADLGSLMSNLATARDHVRVMKEALQASESQIRDADVATETSAFARSQVLMQAGVAMLAQANAQPQLALRLLG
jgi:flagellin